MKTAAHTPEIIQDTKNLRSDTKKPGYLHFTVYGLLFVIWMVIELHN